MSINLGIFAVPDASDPATTVQTIVAADVAGLDLGEDVAPRLRALV